MTDHQQVIKELQSVFNNFGYCSNSNITTTIILSQFLALFCYIANKLTGNYSWVDRLWSIVPSIFALNFVIHDYLCRNELSHPRVLLINGLILLWGIRLTYNFYRKGGYHKGGEDYRWEWLRNYLNNNFLMEIFNITFINIYQLLLLCLITVPIGFCSGPALNVFDFILSLAFLSLLTLETVADNQQWGFHQKKLAVRLGKAKSDDEVKRGFLTSGVFRYSRHPNFFSEMSLWWVVFAFSALAAQRGLNWTIVGTILLTLLFQGSTTLTEHITSSKYPEYRLYQKSVSRIVPFLGGRFDSTKTK